MTASNDITVDLGLIDPAQDTPSTNIIRAADLSLLTHQALDSLPFKKRDVREVFRTEEALIATGRDNTIREYTEEGGWVTLSSGKKGDIHVTGDGDIFRLNGRWGLSEFDRESGTWTSIDGFGTHSGDLAGNDTTLVTMSGPRKGGIDQILLMDIESRQITTVAVDPIANKAGRATVQLYDDRILVRDDRGQYFEIDRDTGEKTRTAWLAEEGYREAAGLTGTGGATLSLEDALAASPFNADHIRQAVTVDAGHFVNITKKNGDYGIWTYNDDAGWVHLETDDFGREREMTGDMVVTDDGAVYMANSRGLFHLDTGFDGGMSWIGLPISGRNSGDLAGNDDFLVSFTGKHRLDTMIIVDLETKEIQQIDLPKSLDGKAGRADVQVLEDGTIMVRDAGRKYWTIDQETGEATRVVDQGLPAPFREKLDVVSEADGIGLAAAVREAGEEGWIDITGDLEAIVGRKLHEKTVDGMTMKDGSLYVIVDNPAAGEAAGASGAIYRHDGDGWELAVVTDIYGGGGALIAGDGNQMFVGIHQGIGLLDLETGELNRISDTAQTQMHTTHKAKYVDGKLYTLSSTKGTALEGESQRAVSVYDVESGTWTHLPVNFDMDRKPHIDVEVDKDGNVWFKSNYSGIYKADLQEDGSFAPFVQVSDRSGALFLGADGEMYLSYEVTKYTQIASVFKYTGEAGDAAWEMVHTDRGYGIEGTAVDGTDVTFMNGGRFSEFAISDTQKWNLPEVTGGNARTLASDDGMVFAYVRNSDDSVSLKALDVRDAVTSVAPYDADLKVASAKNLVDEEAATSRASGLEILSDGTIAVAMSAGGVHELKIMSEDGKTELGSFATGKVNDMDTNPDGSTLVLATDQGVQLFDADLGVFTALTDTRADRVDLDAAGNVSVLSGKTVTVFDAAGMEIFNKTFGFSYVRDVAIDAESGMVYVTGFSNGRLPDGLPVQGPHLRGYDLETGELAWTRFEFPGSAKSSNIADARLYNVEIGQDGELYIMGESAGTQTIFRYDGTTLNGEEMTTKIDHANDLWNTASAHVLYHARVDKETGDVEQSQMTMSRLQSSGKSNTFKAGDIAVDEQGRMFIGGENAAYLQNRDGISINGVDVPDYDGSDPSFMALSADFGTRYSWHSLDMGGSDGIVQQVATRDGKTVILTEYEDGELFTTDGPANNGGANVNLAVIQSGEIYQSQQEREAQQPEPEAPELEIPEATHTVIGGIVRAVAEEQAPAVSGRELHVDAVNGSEAGDGSLDNPFLTILDASRAAQAGDTVYIHEGVYRETLDPRSSGTEDAPITYTAWNDETVVVTPMDAVTGWERTDENPNVWVVDMDVPDSWSMPGIKVLAGGEAMVEARWPNIPTLEEAARAGREGAALSDAGRMVDKDTKIGAYTDADLDELDGVDLTGATIVTEHGQAWWSNEFQVTGHDADTNEISFDMSSVSDNWFNGLIAEPKHDNTYHLEGKHAFLDTANEYYFDQTAQKFYVHLAEGQTPDMLGIEVQQRWHAAWIGDESHIKVDGLKFVGGQVHVGDKSSHVDLSNIEVTHGAKWAAVVLGGEDNSLTDSHIHKHTGTAVAGRGTGHTIENNVIHDPLEYGSGIYVQRESTDMTVTGNTLFNTVGGTIGFGADASDISYNHSFNGGIGRVTDISMMNDIIHGDREGTQVHHNIVHDAVSLWRPHEDERYWGMSGIRVDTGPSNLDMHHNIVWNTSKPDALVVRGNQPGEENHGDLSIDVYNNTMIGKLRTAGLTESESTEGTDAWGNLVVKGPLDLEQDSGGNELLSGSERFENIQDYDFTTDGTGGAYANGFWTAGAYQGAQVFQGSDGADTLFGGEGDDWLMGGAGDDTYTGFSVGAFGHNMIVDAAGDADLLDLWNIVWDDMDATKWSAVDTNGDGNLDGLSIAPTGRMSVTIADYFGDGHIETIVTRTDGAMDLAGVRAKLHTDIIGTDGSDNLSGAGINAAMSAGLGDDFYFVDAATDLVQERIGEGTDTVISTVSTELGWHVENLILAGDGDIDGTGNTGENILTSNTGDNVLDGGLGKDTYVFGDQWGVDQITDRDGEAVFDFSGVTTDIVFDAAAADRATGMVELTSGDNSLTFVGEHRGDGTKVHDWTLGSGDDQMVASYRADVVRGGDGNDVINSRGGGDLVFGEGGNDDLRAWGGDNTLHGGEGNDELRGGNGNDTLTGGEGNDWITGNDGDDLIIGGAGDDFLAGYNGSDTFVFEAGWGKDDLINGDNDGDFDLVDMSTIDFGDVSLARVSHRLLITSGDDELTLHGFFNGTQEEIGAQAVDAIQFQDDVLLDHTHQDIQTLMMNEELI